MIENRVKADAMNIEAFGDYDFDEHPFSVLGGYDRARRVFGGEASPGRLFARFNVAVFEQAGAADKPHSGQGRAL